MNDILNDIINEVQKEVARIKEMIAVSQILLQGQGKFAVHEILIAEAERAIREQDKTVLVSILPTLREIQ